MKVSLGFWICILALGCNPPTEAQTMTSLVLGTAPSSEVVLTRFDASDVPGFTRLLRLSPAIANLQPTCFILKNDTDKAIIGVAVQWTVVASNGSEILIPFSSHSYIQPGFAPLAAPHERLIVMPGMFIQEPLLKSTGIIVSSPDKRVVDRFQNSKETRVEIDSIIFSDGEVVGPNTRHLESDIQARKDAADITVRQVNAAAAVLLGPTEQATDYSARAEHIHRIAHGIRDQLPREHQIAVALHELTRPGSSNPSSRHAASFARDLLQTDHFSGMLEYIESIPTPPHFYRKDGQKL